MTEPHYGGPVPMVLAMVICDAIYQDPTTHKCTLLGTFSTINARQFPAVHRQMAVHVALTNGHGKTRIRLTMVGPGEQDPALFSSEGFIDFTDPRLVAELNFSMTSLTFPRPGEYRIQLYANDELLMERRLYLLQMGTQPTSMPPTG